MWFEAGSKPERSFAVANEFLNSGYPRLEALGKRMYECGASLRVLKKKNKPGYRMFSIRCKSFFCDFCNGLTFLSVREILDQVQFDDGRKYLFCTFTMPKVSVSNLKKTLRAMSKNWDLMVRSQFFKHVDGFYKKVEFNFKNGNCNPHYHILLSFFEKDLTENKRLVNKLDRLILEKGNFKNKDFNFHYFFMQKGFYYQKVFSLLLEKYGFGKICDVREVKTSSIKDELCKYITKGFNFPVEQTPEIFFQLMYLRKFSFGRRFSEYKSTFVFDQFDSKEFVDVGDFFNFAKIVYENPDYEKVKFLNFLIERQFVGDVLFPITLKKE